MSQAIFMHYLRLTIGWGGAIGIPLAVLAVLWLSGGWVLIAILIGIPVAIVAVYALWLVCIGLLGSELGGW